MKLLRRLVVSPIVAAVVLAAFSAIPVMAGDELLTDPPPVEGIGPSEDAQVTADRYRGPASVTHKADACRPGEVCPEHFSVQTHVHKVDSIYQRYDGYYDYSTGMGCTGPCTLAATQTMSWTNKWGVSIGFDKGPVSAKVGYDVTYSTAWSFTFSFPVSSGQTKVVRFKDWYHVTRMYVHTDYLAWGCPYAYCPAWTESGTAWAGKWYQRIFYAALV